MARTGTVGMVLKIDKVWCGLHRRGPGRGGEGWYGRVRDGTVRDGAH
jgi:hypothetical protein